MRRYAITVGVQDYASGSDVAPLRYASADAVAIGNALRERCRFDEVCILTTMDSTNAPLTDTAILTALRDMAARMNEDDLFLFFFAGHGVEQRISGQKRSFLLAPNANLQFMTGFLDMAMIQEIMARMACSQRIFLMDCCRNDPQVGRGDAGNPMTDRMTRDILAAATRPHIPQTNRVTLVMNACRPGERSYERSDVGHGAFSYWIIQGLLGGAWTDEGLEGAQLCRYVDASLMDWSQRTGLKQHADFQQLESASMVWLARGDNPPRALHQAFAIQPLSPPVFETHLKLFDQTVVPLQFIPKGEFLMGSEVEDAASFNNERPRHGVRITRDFLIAKNPVSAEQWDTVMENSGYRSGEGNSPVKGISWDDAQLFISYLNGILCSGRASVQLLDGAWRARLPTEAEWEYAVSINRESDLACWLGICWQWCEDWYGPYCHGLAIDPKGPREGTRRVLRGASPSTDHRFLRAAARGHGLPDARHEDIGFRFVLVKGHCD